MMAGSLYLSLLSFLYIIVCLYYVNVVVYIWRFILYHCYQQHSFIHTHFLYVLELVVQNIVFMSENNICSPVHNQLKGMKAQQHAVLCILIGYVVINNP